MHSRSSSAWPARRVPEAGQALTLPFGGQSFTLPDTPNPMALMEYAAVLNSGVHPESLDGLGALHELLEWCLGESWPEFRDLALEQRSSADELLSVVRDVFAVYVDRPTGRPSDSSEGPAPTVVRSEGDAFSRAKANLEAKGRPDLAVVVMDAEAAQKTA